MSTKAQAILDEIRALPPKEQREVSEFIVHHIVSSCHLQRRAA